MGSTSEHEEMLQDFLTEAGELLDDVDKGLLALERTPGDAELLNRVFRGFHTVKGGAGFLGADALVDICHRGEGLLDALRQNTLALTPEVMDLIMSATGEVRRMFGELSAGAEVRPAPVALINAIDRTKGPGAGLPAGMAVAHATREPDWALLHAALVSSTRSVAGPDVGSPVRPTAAAPPPPKPTATPAAARETTLRVDTARFDQILNLSGEIGLTRNRLACLVAEPGTRDAGASQGAIEAAVAQLDTLVSDLQTTVMKARMQPVGRVFQKYVRLARDLGRTLGKEIELQLVGEDTEVDKNMLEELNDPLVHLVRNAVDHGLETPQERRASAKPERGTVRIVARQSGDNIVIVVSDDGRGMCPETIRAKAVEKGVLTAVEAARLDDRHSLDLVFTPGFSTCSQVSDVSGRGVGMDVVKTNIRKLKGRIEIASVAGQGSTVTIVLPLTLAILPVLMLREGAQTYAVPLSSVREVVGLDAADTQWVGGRAALVIRGEVLPLVPLAPLLGLATGAPGGVGIVTTLGERTIVLHVGAVLGQDEVMIKPLEGLKPRGVAGATLSGEGQLVLVLELQDLLETIL